MSDFLGRIAARAVGEAPVAQPRLPALFERSGAEAFGPGIVDQEVVVPAPTREALVVEPAYPTGDARPREAQEPFVTADIDARQEDPGGTRTAAAAWAEQIATPPRPSDTLSLGVSEELAASPAPAHAAAPEQPVSVVPVVVASPASVDVGSTAPAAPPAAAAVRDEQPAVRVHIGRLEVRANLQDAAQPPQPRPAAPTSQGLSLADYLRGKREAG